MNLTSFFPFHCIRSNQFCTMAFLRVWPFLRIWLHLESPVWSQTPLSYTKTKHIMQWWQWRVRPYPKADKFYRANLRCKRVWIKISIRIFNYRFALLKRKTLCHIEPQEHIFRELKLRLKRIIIKKIK